ncbi:MAG: nuclease-related domain-containing protein [Nakamurella sp.]
MTDWTVRRWARFGRERLYAETPGGAALGYFDVKTGQFHSDDFSNVPLLERAIADYRAEKSLRGRAPRAQFAPDALETALHLATPTGICALASPSASPSVSMADALNPPALEQLPVPEWSDISQTRPGAAARERAIAERRAAPVRTTLARLLGVKNDERAWRIGADGEEAVAAQLSTLGPEWRILHAVLVGDQGSDIDHVVIGPGGVFTVNAKHHPRAAIWVGGDTFMVNGQRVPYIRNSRHEARRAARLLTNHAGFPVSATGLVAVMGAQRGFTIKEQPRDGAVVVVQRKRIRQHLLRQGTQLSAPEVANIYDVARRSTTWR